MAESGNKCELRLITKFYKFHDCSELIQSLGDKVKPLSSINTDVPMWKACETILKNGTQGTPVWHTEKKHFVGITTVADFIKILHVCKTSPFLKDLTDNNIEMWFEFLNVSLEPFLPISPNSSLLDVVNTLNANKAHHLPIFKENSGDVANFMTYEKILNFLFINLDKLPNSSIMGITLGELDVITINNFETCTEEASVFEVIPKFIDNRVAVLPIVNSEGKLKDLWYKQDVINMLIQINEGYHDLKLKDIFNNSSQLVKSTLTCSLNDTLVAIMEKYVQSEVSNLVVVDETDKVVGNLFLTDFLYSIQYYFPAKHMVGSPSK